MKPHPSDPAPARRAGHAQEGPIEALIHHPAEEVQRRVAADLRLTEDLALAFLARRDLARAAIEDLTKNASVMKSRPVINALVRHPRTPRHVSIPIVRHLYTFELMHVALTPGAPADVKMAAEEALVLRLDTIASGERLSLAKQSSGRVAAALLLDEESRVIIAALDNPQMTEAWIVKTLRNERAPQTFVELVCRHRKWSLREEVRLALLRNAITPLGRILQIAQSLPTAALRDALRDAPLKASVKMYLFKELDARTGKALETRNEKPKTSP
ncbi:MAG: hypothetical protein L0099_01430 [Acidobacteria bacterium]|nr:hypothetical protein [Acidobacteriota bacterium]